MNRIDNATITSKFSAHTFTLKEINAKLEAVNACLVLHANDDGTLEDASLLDKDGFPATVVTSPGFTKPVVERYEKSSG